MQRQEEGAGMTSAGVKKYKKEMPKIITTVSAAAMLALMEHDWQGNIRQLENVIYRAMVTTRTETIEVEDLYMEPRKDHISAPENPASQELFAAPSRNYSMTDRVENYEGIGQKCSYRSSKNHRGECLNKLQRRLDRSAEQLFNFCEQKEAIST